MQPYFLPYIGYFQLIHAADKFVVYDNIQFTKKGWINRNRILVNGKDEYVSIPLKKDSDYLNVNQRVISELFDDEGPKTVRKIKELYKKAPYFDIAFPLIENIYGFEDRNLFNFIHHSLELLCRHFNIHTEFVVSSTIAIDHTLKSEEKVISLCEAMGASTYINAIGGMELYDEARFAGKNVDLQFIKTQPVTYKQFGNEFVPWLSIIDVMMFNSPETVEQFIKKEFTLIKKGTHEI